MMGPPTFPDVAVPDFAEFCEDWVEEYWTHAAPTEGRLFVIEHQHEAVGVIAHNAVVTTPDGERASELDMWLRGAEYIGRGFAQAAIAEVCRLLESELRVDVMFLQPSARNPRGIRAYERAGFVAVAMNCEQAAKYYQTEPDYCDSVFLACRHPERTRKT